MDTALRKQPQQRRSHATFNWMLDATEDILCRCGTDGFNTNVVAERAGVSVGSLYQYFPNKMSLAAAVWERHVVQQIEIVEAAVADPETGLENSIDRIIDHAVDLHACRIPFHSALHRLVEPLGQPTWFVALMDRRNRAFLTLFQAHASELAVDDLRVASVVCAEAIRCLSNNELLHASGVSAAALKFAIRSMLLSYLRGGCSMGGLHDRMHAIAAR